MKVSTKRDTIRRYIEEIGVVPVVRAPSAELALRAAEAVLAGGISVFEITMTVPGARRRDPRACASASAAARSSARGRC